MDQPLPGARLIVDALPGAGAACRVEGEEAAHARARRLAAGDAVVLVDGSGREAAGRVARIGRGFVDVDVEAVRAAAPDAGSFIHLLVAAVRSERLSWIAEKATELGAARLTLVATRADPALPRERRPRPAPGARRAGGGQAGGSRALARRSPDRSRSRRRCATSARPRACSWTSAANRFPPACRRRRRRCSSARRAAGPTASSPRRSRPDGSRRRSRPESCAPRPRRSRR